MTSSLAPGVRDRVIALLWKYQDVIAINDNDLGHTQLLGHCIDTSDALPVRQPARRLPFHQQEEVRGLIDLLSQGIIEPCCGPWASPIISTPFELMIGHDPRLPEDVLFMQQAHARVLQYMELQQQRQKEYYDKGVTEKTYAPEDRQPVIGPAPNVPGPRLSTRVRRPTMHYGDPAEIPDTIQDEELFG
ncbi:hypothetical protein EMCRGX_G006515 [Ephydatia muelleri]